MVYLIALFLSIALNIGNRIHAVDYQQQHSVTIINHDSSQTQDLLAALNDDEGVISVTLLPSKQLAARLSPWLGQNRSTGHVEESSLPSVLTLALSDSLLTNIEPWKRDIKTAYPSISIREHAAWLHDYFNVLRSAQWVLLAIAATLLIIIFAILTLVIRMELGLQKETIELLHRFGASDPYISKEYGYHHRRLGLYAIIPALILSTGTLFLFQWSSNTLDNNVAGLFTFGFEHLTLIAILGGLVLLLLHITSRLSCLHTLQSMP